MKIISLQKKDYFQLSEVYDWNQLSDAKGIKMFPFYRHFPKKIILSIFSQFKSIEVLENNTIWGKYGEQKLLIAYATGIYWATENMHFVQKGMEYNLNA